MWTVVNNKSEAVTGNSSETAAPDVTLPLLHPVQLNGSTADATHPSGPEDSSTSRSGIVPATVFIALLRALYAVLWKCMVSPPRRKHSKLRVRVKRKTSV
ncbi:uncharacterized protein sb:cb288 [Pseudoliparis swirei]|uniref:uncharacterized protein sb:cb288 n=1 Tax=Pseudoliparis swirei TaxID=2059687 RepID=UPI0024BE6974|nr:uncharacterized protein sb:cb288 [Pseudoliparis swirei]